MASRSTTAAENASAPSYLVPFIIVTALFGIFGFLTNLNSNLSPKLEQIFDLNHAWSNTVATSWFLAYLLFSVPSAKVIEKVGYKRTMVISLFVMVRCCLSRLRISSAFPFSCLPALCWPPAYVDCRPRPIHTSRFWGPNTALPHGLRWHRHLTPLAPR